MKIKFSIIIVLFVTLSGCMGIVVEKESSPKAQSDSGHENKVITHSGLRDLNEKKGVTNKRRIARMMDWVNLSTD